MLAHPLDEDEGCSTSSIPPTIAAEWKWDGIRVQLVVGKGGGRGSTRRTGDDIAAAFPDIVEAVDFEAVLDGELLVGAGDGDAVASVQRSAAAAQPQGRDAADAARLPGLRARSTTSCSTVGEDLRPLPLDGAPRAARGVVRARSGRRAWTSRPLVEPFATGEALDALAPRRPRHGRSRA